MRWRFGEIRPHFYWLFSLGKSIIAWKVGIFPAWIYFFFCKVHHVPWCIYERQLEQGRATEAFFFIQIQRRYLFCSLIHQGYRLKKKSRYLPRLSSLHTGLEWFVNKKKRLLFSSVVPSRRKYFHRNPVSGQDHAFQLAHLSRVVSGDYSVL